MPDFSLSAKIVITEVDASKLKAALNQLKNIKSPLDVKKMQGMADQTKKLAVATELAKKQTAALQRQYQQMRTAQQQLKNAKNAVDKLSSSTKKASGNVKTLAERMTEIGPRAMAFRVSTIMINGFVNAISEAITFLRELDQIMADIQKISGQSSAQLASMGDKLIDIASTYGLAAAEVAEQFKTIIQAGFKAARAMDIVGQAAMGAAATTLNFAKATEILIQTIKVFGEQDAATLFDQIAVAESNAAVTAKDIQDAMKRSAATFKAVNADISDMIGLISSLQETSRRGGAVVGTAFRTINTRLIAGDTAEAVKKLGVAVADAEGNLRPMMDVLADLASKFRSLTEEERVQAATVIAGRRQFESFVQILDNVDRAQELSAASAAAHGEAQKRAAIQVETINGLLNQLSNAFLKAVKSSEGFIPMISVFKEMVKALTFVLTVSDGVVGKFAALAGSLLLMKGLAKVVAPLLKGAMAGAGGLLIGGGGRAAAFGGKAAAGGAGAAAGAAAGKAASAFSALRISLLGITAVGIAASVAFKNVEGTLGQVGRDAGELGTIMGTAFMFGPIIGSIVTLGFSAVKAKTAISTFNDRHDAYMKSIKEFGSQTLARTQSALIDARAAGDDYTALLLEQSAAFDMASIRLAKDAELSEKALNRITDGIAKFVEATPKQAPSAMDIREIVTIGLKRAGFKEEAIPLLMATGSAMKLIFDASSALTDVIGESAESMRHLEEIMKANAEAAMNAAASMEFIDKMLRNILGSQEILKAQHDYTRALDEAALANRIFVDGITDVIEVRRLQAKQELDFAHESFRNQTDFFNKAVQDFDSSMKGLNVDIDIASVQELFQILSEGSKTSSQKKSIMTEALGRMAAGIDAEGTDKVRKAIHKLLLSFFELDVGRLKKGVAAGRKFPKALRDIDFDELNQAMKDSEIARKNEQNRIIKVNNLLEGLSVDTSDFEQLANTAQGSTEEMIQFLGIIEKMKNPISQARLELAAIIDKEIENVRVLEDTRQGIRDQIKAYEAMAPGQKKNAALKARDLELTKASNNIEIAKANALKRTAGATKKVMSEQKKAAEGAAEAQSKLTASLQELAEATEEAIVQADIESQGDLKDAQQSVMESAENLSDAYRDLRDAQLSLGDSIADYRLGILMADREIAMITGNIRGFSEQFRSIQNVFDEVLASAAMTEQQKLELLRASAAQQLQLIQSVIDETRSIGQKIFGMDAAGGAELTKGFAALRDVISQFQTGGGFEGIDLNEFGNMLLSLPQSIRQEMLAALGALPSTATLGGLSKSEIENILFGSAVGESEEANIQNINGLTETQVELIGQIAELNQAGILAANAQLMEAQKQVALAEEQLSMDEIMLARAEENVQVVREEISHAAMLLNAMQVEIGNLISESTSILWGVNKENAAKRAQEHASRLSALQVIGANTEGLATSIASFMSALALTGAAGGNIPRNFAGGNMREVAGLVKAYHAEKRAAPGANPVIANDSEWIIPTKGRGNVPNYQAGNAAKIDINSVEMERLLTSILEEIQAQRQTEGGVASSVVSVANTEPIQATININAEQKVQITGATTIADTVANSVKRAFGDSLDNNQIDMISEQMLEIFEVLKTRGLMNSLGGGL